MKFTINKKEIRDILSKIQGITGRKSNLTITENVLFKVSSEGIYVSATDLETGFQGNYPADVEAEGDFAINARKLFEIVKDFPSDEIHFNEVENRWIKIGNNSIEYNIVGINPDDFPNQPQVDDVALFDIDAPALKRMIEKMTVISGATDDRRPHISGIYFERILADDQKLVRIVSTDGSRLAKTDYNYDPDFELPEGPSVIIPKKAIHEVGKFLPSEGTVQLGVKNNYFVVKRDPEMMIIRLLEGDFPKYADIINRTQGQIIKISRAMFLMTLKRMSILSSENYKGVVFEFKDNRLKVTATNPDIGESKEEIDAETEGEPIRIAFNPKYFIDALGSVEEETVILNLLSEDRPCLLNGEGNKDFLCVIMPMRI
jgi:DNA polymerase-3 subunit beta